MNQVPGQSFGESPIVPRQPSEGMGQAIARRTVFRESDDNDWGKVADRVSTGNIRLLELLKDTALAEGKERELEEKYLRNAIACGAILTSGRHLQHGDLEQIERGQEVFSNCAVSATTYGLTLLLLCGSGVGRSYDDDLIIVDYKNAPKLWFILNPNHKDFPNTFESKMELFETCMGKVGTDEEITEFFEEFIHTDFPEGEPPVQGAPYYRIDDSREGWAKSVEILESMAFNKEKDGLLVLDFSSIRPRGSPINGMQGRACTGPIAWIKAFLKSQLRVITPAKLNDMPLWEQAMRLDHIFAEEIVSGGVRRSARLSSKSWKDAGIFDFIKIKNESNLWTSNNSVMVDREFWEYVRNENDLSKLARHAKRVFEEITENSYETGEPGIINGDKLEDYKTGFARKKPVFFHGEGFSSNKYQTNEAAKLLIELETRSVNTRFPMTVNPCSEIPLHTTGGFCIVADSAPILACPVSLLKVKAGKLNNDIALLWDKRVEDSMRLLARFLIRVNLMDSVYRKETQRTNRIGVSITGIHEWAWLRFGFGFRDLLDEIKSQPFWQFLARLSEIAKEEANSYSDLLGLVHPTTVTTVKPSGSVSKLYSLTEGVHLPARRQYLRWVQFRGKKDHTGNWEFDSDPLLKFYEDKGYPIKELKTFHGTTIVGFPTQLLLEDLKIGNKCVIATEASPKEQYRWLQLLETFWLGENQSNNISYTAKIYTNEYSLEEFRKIVLENQPLIKCCSILPTLPEDQLGYEYLPEEIISEREFRKIKRQIGEPIEEDVDMDTLRCESGVCPL